MTKRIEKIQEGLREKNIDGFLVSNPSNIFYLTGLKGILTEREFLLTISKNKAMKTSSSSSASFRIRRNSAYEIIVPEMYALEAKRKSPNLFMAKERDGLFAGAIETLKNYLNIGFERDDLKYGEYLFLLNNLKGRNIIPVSKFIEDSRKIKSGEEISLIKKAVKIGDKTFESVLKIIKPGLSEKYIQRKINHIQFASATCG